MKGRATAHFLHRFRGVGWWIISQPRRQPLPARFCRRPAINCAMQVKVNIPFALS